MEKSLKITGFLLLASCVILSSCLKDSPLTLDTAQTNNVTEFANTGSIATLPSGSAAPRFSIDLGSLKVGDTASFKVNVDYAGADMAPQDISVVIDVDHSLLETYNQEHSVDGANYLAPPDDLITASFPITLVIPKGQQFAQTVIPVKLPADFDFNATYALPLKITSTSTGLISGNFGAALYALNVRNIYDGVYDINGYILREGDPVLTGYYSGYQVSMTTSGPFSIQYDHHPWKDGSSVGGIDGLTLTINPTTNKVTVSCVTNPAVVNLPGYDSRYDPASKTFFVSYYWGAGPTNRAATDTLVYNGPR